MTKKKTISKKRVLYFDDEPFFTGALAKSLEIIGWNVTMVSKIDDLFKELRTRQFNILILDIMGPIPNMQNKYINFSAQEIDNMKAYRGTNVGVMLAKRVWQDFKTNLPILFLSARSNPIPEDPELNNHKCDYLGKPQLADAVDEKLKELLNR